MKRYALVESYTWTSLIELKAGLLIHGYMYANRLASGWPGNLAYLCRVQIMLQKYDFYCLTQTPGQRSAKVQCSSSRSGLRETGRR